MDFKVLLADDDPAMRLVMRKIVEKSDGFAIVGEASDGAEAVEKAAEAVHQWVVSTFDEAMNRFNRRGAG